MLNELFYHDTNSALVGYVTVIIIRPSWFKLIRLDLGDINIYFLANDLLVREYTLTYGVEEREKSITLQVADDGIAENEETFILYTNFMETLSDRCAIAVRLQDNDGVFIWH